MDQLVSCSSNVKQTKLTKFEISIKTGDRKRSGTDAIVKIQLMGQTQTTSPVTLDVLFRNDFQRGRSDKFIVKMEDIGAPLLCKLC